MSFGYLSPELVRRRGEPRPPVPSHLLPAERGRARPALHTTGRALDRTWRCDPMHNPRAVPNRPIPRLVRIRHHADTPPKPLGCRWCGHPPYAHDASSLPHRRHHEWEHPTTVQMRARLDARRRLGQCGPVPVPVPERPLRIHPPVVPVRLGRHTRTPLMAAADSPPGRRPPTGGRLPSRRVASA